MISFVFVSWFGNRSSTATVVLSSEAVRTGELIGFVVSTIFGEIESEELGHGIMFLRVFTSLEEFFCDFFWRNKECRGEVGNIVFSCHFCCGKKTRGIARIATI